MTPTNADAGQVAGGKPALGRLPIQPKSEQSILIEGERIKAVSGGFIDPAPGDELIDLRKKFVLPGLIGCHVT